MAAKVGRRAFLQTTAAGGVVCFGGAGVLAAGDAKPAGLISPGCCGSKVPIAKIYFGRPGAHWPSPVMDFDAEVKKYEAEFAKMGKEFADVDFVVNEVVTSAADAQKLKDRLAAVDGVLGIHISMAGIIPAVREILSAGKPMVLFAAPYSGHEWASFGALRNDTAGALLECMLTSDLGQLAVAVRPFRAIHHMRGAKILDVTTSQLSADYLKAIKDKFGTEVKQIGRQEVWDAYNAVSDDDAKAENERWCSQATAIVEPTKDQVFKACKLALAFENMLAAEKATVLTVECYGSMYRQLPAFQCIGFTRLNDRGYGGICESDLQSAMTHVLCQSLSGKPGFISDPTVDESTKSIILAHCLGSTKMDGPDGKACPYKIRTVMERQEGVVTQVKMDIGRKVTQAILVGTDLLLYFTGDIIDTPDLDRGCRTKINVKVDGCIEKLWQNWSHGLHRVTFYGDLIPDLKRFCRFKGITLTNEA
jgi:hypothetical protein